MPENVNPIPAGFHSLTPAITCKKAAAAIDFYKEAFGATEINRMPGPGGMIMHSELRIGNSVIFVSDEFPGTSAAPAPGSIPSSYLFFYTEDADGAFNRAVAGGSSVTMPIADMFWGDRYGRLTDPFGHSWGVATHVEDVSPDEMVRRSAEWTAKMTGSAAAAVGAS
jgi:PhnB protein